MQHHRTKSAQQATNGIETTYRIVWTTDPAVQLGVDLQTEEFLLLTRHGAMLTFQLHFGHH